jgi:hypothetical protein
MSKRGREIIIKLMEKPKEIKQEKPTKISQKITETILEDDQIKSSQEKIKASKIKIALSKARLDSEKEEEETRETQLEWEATKESEKLVQYILDYVVDDTDEVCEDIREYLSEKSLKQVIEDAFKGHTLNPNLIDDGNKYSVYDWCWNKLRDYVREVKREILLNRFHQTYLSIYCTKKIEDNEVCKIVRVYDPAHTNRFYCPKHQRSGEYYYYPCPICKEMEEEINDGEDNKYSYEYQPNSNLLKCTNCGGERLLDIKRLEDLGTLRERWLNNRDKAIQDGVDLSNANAFADSLTYVTWDKRYNSRRKAAFKLPKPDTLADELAKFLVHSKSINYEKAVRLINNPITYEKVWKDFIARDVEVEDQLSQKEKNLIVFNQSLKNIEEDISRNKGDADNFNNLAEQARQKYRRIIADGEDAIRAIVLRDSDKNEAKKKGFVEGAKSRDSEISKIRSNFNDEIRIMKETHKKEKEDLEKDKLKQAKTILALNKESISLNDECNVTVGKTDYLTGLLGEKNKATETLLTEKTDLLRKLSEALKRSDKSEEELKIEKNQHKLDLESKAKVEGETKEHLEKITALDNKVKKLTAEKKDFREKAASMLIQTVNSIAQPTKYSFPKELSDNDIPKKVNSIIRTEANKLKNKDYWNHVEEEANRMFNQLDKEKQRKDLDARAAKAVKEVSDITIRRLRGQTKIPCNRCQGETIINEIPMRCTSPRCTDFALDILRPVQPHITYMSLKDLVSESLTFGTTGP